ncbi:hypothetical protein HYPSUDRAFT_464205 [Hypholoma sublateritium FD-334 SS-4]|uniref:Uncharacterized protein n=1 Tax=Hypholoma sublateritium (strain FD-334 SS-4) TaxID=945553 RepID=A0A0D2P1E4_HYPSF|nr:hypothetical protein HYPSUDRAFT_464205 [Hypholoma sublateritium FD-334 SS-4]
MPNMNKQRAKFFSASRGIKSARNNKEPSRIGEEYSAKTCAVQFDYRRCFICTAKYYNSGACTMLLIRIFRHRAPSFCVWARSRPAVVARGLGLVMVLVSMGWVGEDEDDSPMCMCERRRKNKKK